MLKVYVVGTANSGKTTMSVLIAKTLKEHGFDTEVVPYLPGELRNDYDPFENFDQRVESINRMNGTIKIEEMQAVRNGDFNVIK
jgi:molybdopterin-guanine dinucleotide biosynthesis protein